MIQIVENFDGRFWNLKKKSKEFNQKSFIKALLEISWDFEWNFYTLRLIVKIEESSRITCRQMQFNCVFII